MSYQPWKTWQTWRPPFGTGSTPSLPADPDVIMTTDADTIDMVSADTIKMQGD